MPRRRRRTAAGVRRLPMTNAELSAYNAGARAAHGPDHGPLLAVQSGVVPMWVLEPEEQVAIAGMDPEQACAWFRQGWTEETDRMGEADRPVREEE